MGRYLAIFAASVLFLGGRTDAATFVADLDFSPREGEFGQYLTAFYDFGTRFADVESMSVQLTVPGGFDGFAASTGNSSWHRSLHVQLHDAADRPPASAILNYLVHSLMTVSPHVSTDLQFRRLRIGVGWQVFDAPWPEFVPSGAGAVSIIDVSSHSSHPLPHYESAYTTTTWTVPAFAPRATLTIEGTAVPEPAAMAGWAGLALAALTHRRRIRTRRSRTAAALPG